MKEIKADVRRDEVDQVVEKLEGAGAPGVSIIGFIRSVMGMSRTRSRR